MWITFTNDFDIININKKGRDFVTFLVVIGIIAILASVVVVALNPARQFAQARNTQRFSNVNAILNAIGQNSADNKGVFTCAAGLIPTSTTNMASSSGAYDIANCIVPTYISLMPSDPSTAGSHYTSNSDYNTGYSLVQSSSTGRITVSAPGQELGQVIAVTR